MRTKKTVVILVSGKAGSGKTTIAEMLIKKIQDMPSLTILPHSFAAPIKFIAKAYFGWDEKKDKKGRKLLQQLGGVGREYDEHLWVRHFLHQLDARALVYPFNFSVIDDWRFPNEVAFMKDNPMLQLVTIRVFGRGGLDGEVASDISENSLPETIIEDLTNSVEHTWSDGNKSSEIYNFVIANDTDLEQLESKVDKVLSEISKQYIVE